MSLTAAQLAKLDANTNSAQRFEARIWCFALDALTVSSPSSPGQIDPNPVPIIQPRYGVLRSSEATITLDGSDSYEWPSKGSYDSVSSYAWSVDSGPGSIASGASSASCVVNIPTSDTPTVVKLVVTDSGAATSTAYGRYVKPATAISATLGLQVAGSTNLTGSYNSFGWTADFLIHGDLTNVVSGDPLDNLIVFECDRYWNETMSNFGPYSARPSLMFVGSIREFSQFEESGHYYACVRCATPDAFMTQYRHTTQQFFFYDNSWGATHWYDDELRLVDVAWQILLDCTDVIEYFNIYLWPENSSNTTYIGEIVAHEGKPIWHILADTLGFYGARPYCTAQGDVICGPEPCLLTLPYPGGPLATWGEMFDSANGGALTETYLNNRNIVKRRAEIYSVSLCATRKDFDDDYVYIGGASTANPIGGEKLVMTGYLSRQGLDDYEITDLATDFVERFNHEQDIEVEMETAPVWELGQYSDVLLQGEQQTGGGTTVQADDIFWCSDVTHQINFDRMTWQTRAFLQEVTEQEPAGDAGS